jgi:hypothetical protein
MSGVYTEAERFQKESHAHTVVSTWLNAETSDMFTSSMELKITPSSTSRLWQVNGDGKDRDGKSKVKGFYNSANGRCVCVF